MHVFIGKIWHDTGRAHMFTEKNVMEVCSTGQFSGYLIPSMRKLHNWRNSGASESSWLHVYSSEKLST